MRLRQINSFSSRLRINYSFLHISCHIPIPMKYDMFLSNNEGKWAYLKVVGMASHGIPGK